ncbi:NADPH:quinone reductase [Parasedimentitalea marina]|uniref:NADPH:quinone reductase n=1 Tax=Parasedimentitalea marina TaxID=2483033 RepID=A0A3T0MZ13_9RHOB|nr:NADPH:quinone reductase [Parasedimentitalea marina]AZV77001.1 NADPH:quinone reductase [Parasedimentitalea marina]
MRAIVYSEFGPATDVLSLEDLPTPEPAKGEVLVRLKATGVNPSDVRARAGGRPGITKPPFAQIVPHSDGAGIIEAVGDGVSPDRIGERVWIWNGQWQRAYGTAAEYIALPQDQAVHLPDNTTFEQGAVLGIPALTATHAVLGYGPVAGKTILISGGAGTVGRLAVQIAVAAGARVIATARGEAQLDAARRAGATDVFDYSARDLADLILAATGGQPIDHIVEVEFGKNIDTNTAIIASRGRIVTYGSAQAMAPTLPYYPLLFKAVSIDLVLVYLLTAQERATAIEHLTAMLDQNALDLRISQTLPLEDCAQAHDIIATGARAGSIILTM